MRLVVLLLAWTAVPVATAALALTPNLMFNLSFTDMTGFVRYAEAPGTQNSPPKYWNTSFFNPSGTGDSRHSTTSLNASFLEMYYIGTGIDVYGRFLSDTNGTNWVNFGELGSSYNATPGSQLGVLGSMRDLSWKDHFFSLSLENAAPNPGATLYVHGFTITTGMKTQAPSLDKVATTVYQFATDGRRSNAFTFTGEWNTTTELWQTAVNINPELYNSVIGGPSASVLVPVPANTSFLMLNGTMGPNYDNFTVSFDPPPSIYETSGPYSCYPTNKWTKGGVLMFAAPLDPALVYNMTISGLGDFGLSSVTFFSGLYGEAATTTAAAITSPVETGAETQWATAAVARGSSSTSKGAIAGGVVGGVVGAVLIAAATFWLVVRWVRRQRQKAIEDDNVAFEEDPSVSPTTPFVPSSSPAMVENRPRGRPLPHPPTASSSSTAQARPPPTPTPLDILMAKTKVLRTRPSMRQAPYPPQRQSTHKEVVVDRVELVPPQYDPAWAEEDESGPSGTSASRENVSGPSETSAPPAHEVAQWTK